MVVWLETAGSECPVCEQLQRVTAEVRALSERVERLELDDAKRQWAAGGHLN